jgi:spore germination protein YaaH
MDGINIDFEQVPSEAGADYVQFLRELSIPCRQNGIVLSVDNYVPTEYTAHYGRAEQGEVVDYFIIMGYDEHYSGSSRAGSVASYEYVKAGIENTIKDVPASKVINAVPFYTRLWKISDGVSSEALSMSAAENVLSQYGVTAAWDAETAQNFAEFEADGAKYQIWLEDMQSISAKLNLMSGYRLAGVAAWKLGLEKAEIWDAIGTYLSTSPMNAQPAESQPEEVPQTQVIETD